MGWHSIFTMETYNNKVYIFFLLVNNKNPISNFHILFELTFNRVDLSGWFFFILMMSIIYIEFNTWPVYRRL